MSRKSLPPDGLPATKTIPSLSRSNSSFNQDSNVSEQLKLPPDNFSNIKSCSHILSVLESKAKETVFQTYKQAVAISKTISSDNIYTSKKDGSVYSHSKLIEMKFKSLKCTDCSLSNFNFICLQCPHVGCFTNNHAHSHYKLQQHLFAIDSGNGLLFCFLCGEYVNHPRLEQIRSAELHNQPEPNNHYDSGEYSNPKMIATTGLKGFINLGATCFMSSVLQTLIHNPIIKNEYFNNDLHYLNCEKNWESLKNNYIDENNACITCSVDNIFQNFYTATSHEGFGMSNLLIAAWYKNKSLAGFQEQDAHEFWQFLLNEFHSDYERVIKNAQRTLPNPCECITHTSFFGELQSSIKCLACESVTKTVDPVIDLSLEIKNKKNSDQLTLYDCLDLFTLDEKLDVMYTCQKCGDKTKAIKSLKIKTIPPVLSIQLKRFEHKLSSDQFSKIETLVKVPLFLNLTKYCENQPDGGDIDSDKFFELFAVICHIGSVHTGHYIVYVKDGNGQWFKFDDSVITTVSQEEVSNANSYLLYYITHKI